jgi:retron-type reverse transcriptase
VSTLQNLKNASSLEDLAKMLGYQASTLSYVVYKLPSDKKYKKFNIPKKSGGVREICAPTARLKVLQRHLANTLYACCRQIDAEDGLRSLSHGFRERHSIITNARPHKKRRYVLNLDLQDFFPSFNFGRVRGFFIKNRNFQLHEKVATIIAQIACHENKLPQGSPCSPIIANLIAHILDVRLARLAKQNRATYSRYADDLTLSTNQEPFPSILAMRDAAAGSTWTLGDTLINAIQGAGFAINPQKTRMQFKTRRQLVTGLTVNSKVNIRSDYYGQARVMCHSLFKNGVYYYSVAGANANAPPTQEVISALGPIEGILSHIHHVKDSVDQRDDLQKLKCPTSFRTLYKRFLFYRYFVALERPLVICEGKTDNVYLKLAIPKLTAFHPKLGTWSGPAFKSAVSFLNYTNQAHDILGLHGGAGHLKNFLLHYKRWLQTFKNRPLKHPVVALIDNDNGAIEIFKIIKEKFNRSIEHKSSDPFFHLADNLYLVKTPVQGTKEMTCIEDFFEPSVLATELNGKKFNPAKADGANNEFGKVVFAEKIVRPNAGTIDFAKFVPILERLVAVIENYTPRAQSG